MNARSVVRKYLIKTGCSKIRRYVIRGRSRLKIRNKDKGNPAIACEYKNLLSETFLNKKHFFSFSKILAMNQKERLHSIQQFSAKLNIPKLTLRFWEKEFKGILLPLISLCAGQTYPTLPLRKNCCSLRGSIPDKIKI